MSKDSIRILVVDDSETEFFFLKKLFARNNPEDYLFEWEPDPEKAAEHMRKSAYDVFLVDYQLGQITGLELIQEVRAAGCRSPIILITGYGHREIDLEAQKAGADDYLVKSDLTYRYVDKSIRYALERKKTEKSNFENQIKMSHALKMSALGEMSSGIAHEINNPLAIISALASVLLIKANKAEELDPYFVESLNKVIKMCERIAKIVSGLASFSRHEKSDEFEAVDVSTLIKESANLCQGKLAHTGVRLRIGESKVDRMLRCRFGEMMQVLVNLINNAADAVSGMPDSWVSVDVAVEDEHLLIRVTDSGPGIPEDIRKKILQPYFTTKSRGKGTGLGLSISKVIVESHSGDIFIDENMENTCFAIRLPLMPPQCSGAILVVDSDDQVREKFRGLLDGMPYTTLYAATAEEAVKHLARGALAYAFVEYHLPVVSGLVLAEQIRETSESTQLIFLTRHRPVFVPNGLDAKTLYKPLKLEEIQACIEQDTSQQKVSG